MIHIQKKIYFTRGHNTNPEGIFSSVILSKFTGMSFLIFFASDSIIWWGKKTQANGIGIIFRKTKSTVTCHISPHIVKIISKKSSFLFNARLESIKLRWKGTWRISLGAYSIAHFTHYHRNSRPFSFPNGVNNQQSENIKKWTPIDK